MDSGSSGDGRLLLHLKYLNKAIIGTLEKLEGFVSSKVFASHVSCMHALNYPKEAVFWFRFS